MNYVVPFLSLAIFALWGWGAFACGRRYGFDEGAQAEREQQNAREHRRQMAILAEIKRATGRALKVIK